ncbi:LOB domain-containing protein 20 [Platanthera guangdongensis]|uniref:LOB domain-containing protein 20 n=1 Tax=Platanthera guangdongensis TaxID=2320717 RepID=A0ABR2MI40_9ASPA
MPRSLVLPATKTRSSGANKKTEAAKKANAGGIKCRASSSRAAAAAATAPCGACKFLRRRCVSDCVFVPHFGSQQSGAARFAAVHKVFGASNVSKLLQLVPPPRRNHAVLTICYEAQARLSHPVLGCVATIIALQHQVVQLQAELLIVRSQLINSRLGAAGAFRYSQQQLLTAMQPANSFVSNNTELSGTFHTSFGFELCDSRSLMQLSQANLEEGEEALEESTQNPLGFNSVINYSS